MAESSALKRKFNQKDKYTLAEKQELGQLVEKCKKEHDEEVKKLNGKTCYDYKRKKHVLVTPKQGYLAKACRSFYDDLSGVKHNDSRLQSALKLAKRCHEKYLDPGNECLPSEAKKFRESGAGRKIKVLEVRQELFEWFVDVHGTLKARLPVKLFRLKAQPLL